MHATLQLPHVRLSCAVRCVASVVSSGDNACDTATTTCASLLCGAECHIDNATNTNDLVHVQCRGAYLLEVDGRVGQVSGQGWMCSRTEEMSVDGCVGQMGGWVGRGGGCVANLSSLGRRSNNDMIRISETVGRLVRGTDGWVGGQGWWVFCQPVISR